MKGKISAFLPYPDPFSIAAGDYCRRRNDNSIGDLGLNVKYSKHTRVKPVFGIIDNYPNKCHIFTFFICRIYETDIELNRYDLLLYDEVLSRNL